MKVILIKNILHNGDRCLAGQEIELSDDVAKKFIAADLAYCQEPIQSDDDEQQDADEQGAQDEQQDADEQGAQDEQQDADEQGAQDEQSAKKSGGKKGK